MAKRKVNPNIELTGAERAQFDHLVERLNETLSETVAPGLRPIDRLSAICWVTRMYAQSLAMPCNENNVVTYQRGWVRGRGYARKKAGIKV